MFFKGKEPTFVIYKGIVTSPEWVFRKPGEASQQFTVEIPAAGSTDKGDWMQAAESTTKHYNQITVHNAPKSSEVSLTCTDPSVITEHGLTINYEEQLDGWVLWIDSLPATACTLTLLFKYRTL